MAKTTPPVAGPGIGWAISLGLTAHHAAQVFGVSKFAAQRRHGATAELPNLPAATINDLAAAVIAAQKAKKGILAAAREDRRAMKALRRCVRAAEWQDESRAQIQQRADERRIERQAAKVAGKHPAQMSAPPALGVTRLRREVGLPSALTWNDVPPAVRKRPSIAARERDLVALAESSPALRDAILRLHDGAAVERMAALAEREADPGPPDSQLQFLTPGARGRWAMRHALNAERERND